VGGGRGPKKQILKGAFFGGIRRTTKEKLKNRPRKLGGRYKKRKIFGFQRMNFKKPKAETIQVKERAVGRKGGCP